jgi:hypothetical protein
MVTDPRQFRRLGVGFFEVDFVFHKKYTAGCVQGVRTQLTFLKRKAESTSKNPSPERRISRKTAVNCPERTSAKWIFDVGIEKLRAEIFCMSRRPKSCLTARENYEWIV